MLHGPGPNPRAKACAMIVIYPRKMNYYVLQKIKMYTVIRMLRILRIGLVLGVVRMIN